MSTASFKPQQLMVYILTAYGLACSMAVYDSSRRWLRGYLHMHVCMHHACMHTHTHTYTTVLRPSWILSGTTRVSWAICKSAPWLRHITTPASHNSRFFTGQMSFLPPNQQCQSTEGLKIGVYLHVKKSPQVGKVYKYIKRHHKMYSTAQDSIS